MIPRTLFNESHAVFREAARQSIEADIIRHHAQWERDGKVSCDFWLHAGTGGFLSPNVLEEFGGVGAHFKCNAIFIELSCLCVTGPGFAVHSDMAANCLLNLGWSEQKSKWLPKIVLGEAIAAVGLREPVAGSDLKAIKTTATRDDDHYVINGQKVFIFNGQLCDIVILAVKADRDAGAKGMTYILVEAHRPGFKRGRNQDKLELKAQDTSELFFDDLRVSITNRIGDDGQGFAIAMPDLAEERVAIAVGAIGAFEGILDNTFHYMKQCTVFDKTVSE